MIPPASNSNRYTCCCGSCRAVTGAMILCILHLLSSVANVVQNWTARMEHDEYSTTLLSIGAMGLLVAVAGIVGLGRKNAWLLMFELVYSVLLIVCYVILGAMTLLIMILEKKDEERFDNQTLGISVVFFACGLFHIWVFLVFLSAYRAIKELPRFGGDAYAGLPPQTAAMPQYSAAPPPYWYVGQMPPGAPVPYPQHQYPMAAFPPQQPMQPMPASKGGFDPIPS